MVNDLDKDLLDRFQVDQTPLSEEPFTTHVRKHIQSIRFRRSLARHALGLVALIAIAFVSPWLIDGSALLSSGLDRLFSTAEAFLNTTVGMTVVAVLCLPVIYWNRNRIF